MKSSFSFLFVAFLCFTMQAQDAATLVKQAGKALKAYQIDPANSGAKLEEAQSAIDEAFGAGDLSADFKSLLVKGRVYTELLAVDNNDALKASAMGKEYTPKYADLTGDAVNSLKTALGLAQKKFESKSVLQVIAEVSPYINTVANALIGTQTYDKAYKPLMAVIDANDLLVANDEKSLFENPDDVANLKYVAAVCGIQAGDKKNAKKILTELADAGSQDAQIYSNLFSLTIDEDEEQAMKYLAKGRELDPENTELLFAEINHYIKEQKFDVLEVKLKEAIAQDPDNPSIYSALGNVYLNLSQKNGEEGNTADAKKYFDESMTYYEKTIELEPK